jgi:ribosome-associated protein YbcJ (S4-like RNA binding protein)
MGRKQFARDHNVDLEHGMITLTEFLKLTKDAYSGNVIRKAISKMREVD